MVRGSEHTVHTYRTLYDASVKYTHVTRERFPFRKKTHDKKAFTHLTSTWEYSSMSRSMLYPVRLHHQDHLW
mgnify:CR=1 FL=1